MAAQADTISDTAASIGEEHSPSAVVTSLFVVGQLGDRLQRITGLNKNQLVVENPLEDARLIPLDQNELHVFN